MPAHRTLATFLLILAGILASFSLQADELGEIARQVRDSHYAPALAKVDDYLKSHPADAQAMFLKGVALSKLNKREEAIRAFTAITEKHPTLPEPYNNLAVLYAEQGHYDKARKALEAAINTHPSYAAAHNNLANVYAYMASEAYDKALQLDKGRIRSPSSRLAMISDLTIAGKPTLLGAASPTEARNTKQADVTQPASTKSAQPVKPAEPIKLAESAKPAEPIKLAEPTKPAEPIKSPDPAKPVPPAPAPAAAEPAAPPPEPARVAEAPTTKPDNAKPVSSAAGTEKAVKQVIEAWALAWSSQNVEKYLASYADTFKTSNGESRKEWEDTRRERLTRPGAIKVEIAGLRVVEKNDNRARATFKQTYRSGRTVMRTNKVLILKHTGGKWLIEQEQTGS